jgi:hypothetical protein
MHFRAVAHGAISFVLLAARALAWESPAVKSVILAGTRIPVSFTAQAGRPYDDRAIQNAVRKLWSTGPFDDIRVGAKPAADGISVTCRVHETPEVRLREMRILASSFGLRLKSLEGAPITRLVAGGLAGSHLREIR